MVLNRSLPVSNHPPGKLESPLRSEIESIKPIPSFSLRFSELCGRNSLLHSNDLRVTPTLRSFFRTLVPAYPHALVPSSNHPIIQKALNLEINLKNL